MHNIVSRKNSIRQMIKLKYNTSILINDEKPLTRHIIKQILLLIGSFLVLLAIVFVIL